MIELLDEFYEIGKMLFPFLGSLVLLFLCILLFKLIKVVSKIDITLTKADETVFLVNRSIEKIQPPLDAVVKVSNGVAKVYDKSSQFVKDAKVYAVKNIDVLKENLNKVKIKRQKNKIVKKLDQKMEELKNE